MRKLYLLLAWLSFSAITYSQSLVAYYPFNGNANDESGNGRHGTVTNGAFLTTDRFNESNKSYYFDGDNDFIEFPATGLPSTDRTVMFWLNPATGNQPSYPVCYGGSSCGESFLTGFNAGGCGCYNTQGHCGSNALATNPWTSSPANTWVHFTVSVNGSAIKIYINGLTAANNNGFSVATYTSGKKMFIGALITPDGTATYDDGSGGNFKGKLDDVRIYDAAMSDAQVLQMYQNESTGLMAYFPFAGNANDATGNNHHGTISGATLTTDRFGNSNSAYAFNGSSNYIEISQASTLTFSEYTYTAWLYLTAYPAGTNLQTASGVILDIGSIASDQYIYVVNYNPDYGISGSGYYVGGGGYDAHTGTLPNLNQWYHVAVTRSSTAYKLFVNGTLIQTVSLSATGPEYGGSPSGFIGKRSGDLQYFEGKIDEVRIYSKVLSPNEIQQLADIPIMPDLIAYLPMNGDANDKSGNNRNGTTYGGAVLTTDKYDNANSAYYITNPECGISLGNTNNLDFVGQPFAISAWVKYSTIPAADFAVVAKHNCGVPNGYVLSVYNNIPRFYLSTGGWSIISAPQTYNDNTWHHLVATYDGIGAQRLYVDGELKASASSVVYNNPGSGAPIIVGDANGNCGGATFSAGIDEVKIYGAELNANQVSALYKQSRGSGKAVSFDGSGNHIDCGDPVDNSFELTGDGTIEAWAKLSAQPPGIAGNPFRNVPIMAKDNGVSARWVFGLQLDKLVFYWNGNVLASNSFTVTGNLDLNRYYHFALTKSGNTISFYVDGKNAGTFGGVNVPDVPAPFTIGYAEPLYKFNGNIDEIRFWSAALTESQIRDWMNRKLTPDHPQYINLKAYYNFDEPNVYKTYDCKNGITGQFVNGPSVLSSGAAMGDGSSYDFTNSTKTAAVSLTTGESFTAAASTGNPNGISVYVVKDPPESQTGILGLGNNNHYFGVHVSGGNNPQYTAIYNYTGNPFVSPFTEPTLQLFKRTDNSAASWSNSGATLNTTANTLTLTGQNTEYILGSSGFGLPVTLLNFRVQKLNATTAKLIWQTATEFNNKGFEIQRSFDGNYFTGIGFVNGSGNSGALKEYSTTDVPGKTGRVYYRLRQIDFEGKSEFSSVVSVLFDKQGIIKLYPNPAQQQVTIEGVNYYDRIQLLEATGKLVKDISNDKRYLLNINLTGLKSGLYIIRLINGSTTQAIKLVIENYD